MRRNEISGAAGQTERGKEINGIQAQRWVWPPDKVISDNSGVRRRLRRQIAKQERRMHSKNQEG